MLQNAQWIRDTRVKNIAKLNRDNADLPDKATVLAYFTAMSDKAVSYTHLRRSWLHLLGSMFGLPL